MIHWLTMTKMMLEQRYVKYVQLRRLFELYTRTQLNSTLSSLTQI